MTYHSQHSQRAAVDRTAFRDQAVRSFGKGPEIEAILEEIERRRMVKHKFNGKLIMGWTGVEGREVGLLMAQVREEYPELHNMSEDDVRRVTVEVHGRTI